MSCMEALDVELVNAYFGILSKCSIFSSYTSHEPGACSLLGSEIQLRTFADVAASACALAPSWPVGARLQI
jgi:hypothetical protein